MLILIKIGLIAAAFFRGWGILLPLTIALVGSLIALIFKYIMPVIGNFIYDIINLGIIGLFIYMIVKNEHSKFFSFNYSTLFFQKIEELKQKLNKIKI